MADPRYRRRKEARPSEITDAAMEEFAARGYDATRVDDVARRAGVSKGLLYLYFKTKEELFKAVIKSFIQPRVKELGEAIDNPGLSATEFLRGPFLAQVKQVPNSPVRHLVRLMVAEGPKHPDLTAYYWMNVVRPGIDAMSRLFDKGVANGEFRRSAFNDHPQLLMAPVLFSVLWKVIFEAHESLDTDELLEAHVEQLVACLSVGEKA